ncbi:hypothetical protein GQ53DRAFT_415772 [Thozetella sp. PMI_491]|nr:hypothetical protein GQ53DRAFT_415772 [Thozetella sp. PMI_491]
MMWHHSFKALLAGAFLLSTFAVAQESSATTTAAEVTTPSSTTPLASATVTSPANTDPGASSPPASSGTATSPATTTSAGTGSGGGSGSSSGGASPSSSTPPDVLLRVPNLSVGRIELDVDNLQAEVNLAAQVANLVSINAGVAVSVKKVNITIADVDAELELIIRLGHLVDIVNRTLQSLDLNPLLINILNDVTDLVDTVVGAVDGLLGSIIQGTSQINFLIDNLGNIVQEVTNDAGKVLSSIVGNFVDNMTYTGNFQDLGNGLTQKTYSYSPLGSLVNIVFNTLGQVVQAVVVGSGGGGGGGSTSTTSSAPTATPAARRI